jgi:hypothetical protein
MGTSTVAAGDGGIAVKLAPQYEQNAASEDASLSQFGQIIAKIFRPLCI